MVREKLIFKIPTDVPVVPFHPSDLTGGQLYLRKDQATPSSWISAIGLSRDFTQSIATQQPTISTNSVDYDGINDIQIKVEANAFNADTLGILYFSGYYDSSNSTQYIFTTADVSSTAKHLSFGILNGTLFIQATNTSQDVLAGTNVLTNGDYFYGYIKSTGSAYEIGLNGVTEVLNIIAGSNTGNWFNAIPNRDNINLGGLIRSSSIYSKTNLNKLYYNNTSLTASEIIDMNTFMSDPTNF